MRSLICLLLAVGSATNYAYYPTGRQTRNGSEAYDYEYAGQTNPPAPNIESDILDADGTYNYDFDSNGNLIKRTLRTDSSRKTLYFFDYDNRLERVEDYSYTGGSTADETVVYTYDPLGNLVKRVSSGSQETKTTTYTVDIVASLPVVLIEDVLGGQLAKFTYGDDLLKVSRGGEYYYFYDGLGSTRTITNDSGTVVAKYVYYPYGQMVTAECQDATWNDFLFTGQAYDRITGLVYLRARHYDPGTGRFFTRDRYDSLRDGQDDEDNDRSLLAHRYAYCEDDPVNNIDPLGLFTLPDVPSSLPDGWSRDWRHHGPVENPESKQRWISPDEKWGLEWDKGDPSKQGYKKHDHWHRDRYDPDEEDYKKIKDPDEPKHRMPGEEVEPPTEFSTLPPIAIDWEQSAYYARNAAILGGAAIAIYYINLMPDFATATLAAEMGAF